MNERSDRTSDPRIAAKVEQLARRFHEAYERLAPQFGYETRPETREFDPQSPNGQLMIAVCAELREAFQCEACARIYKYGH